MDNMKDAIDRIQGLECPTGELENRVSQILEAYKVANKGDISINREERMDGNGAEAYSVELRNFDKDAMTILAISGPEDYVAKVVDVYQNNN
ncbi:hypothetical protein [Serpentinicella alkaliphila]|uniref:Uncharacterized protein n=1 Tax=Serpentinicella alkaliphila TaxID=1734049 RepID=A0A4R2T464_9FIRM|nr:hypothetical protein [Serpentinicella alkaliphila]QUH27033.1 hypothetical protein HZR23_15775 [Serpentinicella alkaliphila]TCP95624.1 hypothetical protein EDD79_10588 [Serpentinicella alkaliphila]